MKSTTPTRHHEPGEDPALPVDPDAEDASLASDEQGIGKVTGLRREAHTEEPGAETDETSGRFTAIANDADGHKKPKK